jgi:hypothetical protein
MNTKRKLVMLRCMQCSFGYIAGFTLGNLLISKNWIYGVISTVSMFALFVTFYNFAKLCFGKKE